MGVDRYWRCYVSPGFVDRTPVAELAREPDVPARLLSALKSWPADVGEYKGQFRGRWWETVVEYMTDMARH